MNKRLLLATLPFLLLPTGCGAHDANPTSASERSAEPSSPPVGLAGHVVPADGLPGFTSDSEARRLSLASFAEEHDKTVAELRRSGMVAAASMVFEPSTKRQGFGLSVAAEFATEKQAEAEADRLFAANSEPEEGSTVAPLQVPAIPGAQAVTFTGSDGGLSFIGVEIVFTDGLVMHEIFAMGEAPVLDVADVMAAATALYERVAGRPLDDA